MNKSQKLVAAGSIVAALLVLAVVGLLLWNKDTAGGGSSAEPTAPEGLPAVGSAGPGRTTGTAATGPTVGPAGPPSPVIAAYDYTDLALPLPAGLERQALTGRAGVLADPDRRLILWSRNAEEVGAIASITKLMTILVATELVQAGTGLSLDSTAPVSPAAMRIGGSQLWLEAGGEYRLRDLFAGMMIQSANDAAYVVAEYLGPGHDPAAFVTLMNRRSRELGLRRARFFNVHGLPGADAAADNQANCLDLVTLATLVRRLPEVRELCATRQLVFAHHNGKQITMTNHNRLLQSCVGVTGMKTGYIGRAGYCTVVSAERGGQTLLAVGRGFPKHETRDHFICSLLDWGFEQRLPTAPVPTPAGAGPPAGPGAPARPTTDR